MKLPYLLSSKSGFKVRIPWLILIFILFYQGFYNKVFRNSCFDANVVVSVKFLDYFGVMPPLKSFLMLFRTVFPCLHTILHLLQIIQFSLRTARGNYCSKISHRSNINLWFCSTSFHSYQGQIKYWEKSLTPNQTHYF